MIIDLCLSNDSLDDYNHKVFVRHCCVNKFLTLRPKSYNLFSRVFHIWGDMNFCLIKIPPQMANEDDLWHWKEKQNISLKNTNFSDIRNIFVYF